MKNNIMALYDNVEPAFFLERKNRFILRLRKENNEEIDAYIANPGRMEEFLVPDHPFFITQSQTGKYKYHTVSTIYQDSYILLDTIKINRLAEIMLKNKRIDLFKNIKNIRREVKLLNSKFDFLLEPEEEKPIILEIKSCSLCHNGVAMFPDAPTERGKRHLEDLEQLADQGFQTYTLYMINHKNATVFIPNGHTDPDYSRTFCDSQKVKFLAYKFNLIDPITLDLTFFKPVEIDNQKACQIHQDRGSYLMVMYNAAEFTATIGSLGQRTFKKGYYVYAGSALHGLEHRIKRHLKKNKKLHWHIDYISPVHMKTVKVYPIRRADSIEESLARRLMNISEGYINQFGASDSKISSHLFYFPEPPFRRRDFLDLLLDHRMFSLP